MAKRAPKKKINRRTRRLIRRSIAAVMMITAIGVAAIPVPDIQAVDSNGGTTADAAKRKEVEDAAAQAVADGDRKMVEYAIEHDADGNVADGDRLNKDLANTLLNPGHGGHADQITNSPEDHRTYKIRQLSNGRWKYDWQFEFYTVESNEVAAIGGGTSDGAIISRYNMDYDEANVELQATNPLEYFTVPVADYDAFYAVDGEGNRDFKLSYEMYVDTVSTGSPWPAADQQAAVDFFSYYYAADYKTWYDQATKKWNYDYAHPDNATNSPTRPTDLSSNPSAQFSVEQKYRYYCDSVYVPQNIASKGDLTLVYALNGNVAAGSTQSDYIYLVRLADPSKVDEFRGDGNNSRGIPDAAGFLAKTETRQVIGIANEAFKGITKIETLSLPSEILYIGDRAFESSFLQNIELKNVTDIGNGTFRNCTQLKSVTLGSSVHVIGAEAFRGSAITSVTLPYSIQIIGAGAFADCTALKTVDMNAVGGSATQTEIGKYAFFGCYGLDSVKMESSGITKIGDGAFATIATGGMNPTGSWDTVVLPSNISDDGLGDWLFAGRTMLKSVTFPRQFGSLHQAQLPKNTFRNCINLKEVIFPDDGTGTCGLITFPSYLFLDVLEPDLVVSGPMVDINGNFAQPRKDTWVTVSGVSDYVPYKYKNPRTGLEYYEVSRGNYLMTANQNGVLTSCTLTEGAVFDEGEIDLVIPEYVGNYKIKSIDTNCFTDEELRKNIRSITIEDNSVSEIAAGTFQDLPNLQWVVIGNSVSKIGNSAFEGCNKLVDVTFNSPASGDYKGFTIGTNAFHTGSNKLTFHGDIIENYAPFDWAMDPENYIDRDLGIRVCYKSLSPTNLTVLYDNATGNRTLVDYPKYARLDADNQDFITRMENTYYDRYLGSEYDDRRTAFLSEWNAAEDPETVYTSINYGPWINPQWISTIGGSASGNTQLTTPLPYFDKYPYSIIENYENPGDYEWQTLTPLAESWVNSALKITVPAGVDSIDVNAYLTSTSNRMNVSTYLLNVIPDEDYKMYDTPVTDDDNVDSVPGLFSGYFKDFDEETNLEKKTRGNDRIEEVVLQSVKYLPDYAFDSCENLKKVTIGPGCEDIGTAPFRGCDNLSDVVFQNNDKYTSNKGIIYSVNDDKTYTIEECLPYRGMDSISAPPLINLANDPDLANVSAIKEGAFEDCNNISAVDLRDTKNLSEIPEKAFKNCKILSQVYLPATVDLIESEAFAMEIPGEQSRITVTIPGREVHIATDAFQHVPTAMIRSYSDSAAHEYADYHGLAWEDLAETFQVIFMDWDGSIIGDIQYVETDKNAVPPEDPVREGYTFIGWSNDYLGITKDTICLAQYRLNGTGGDPNDPNNPNNPNDPNNPNNPGDDIISDGKSYTVTVVNGSGGGSYLSGSTVRITANTPATGQRFSYWSSSDGVRFADANSATTTFTMPTRNVTVTANYTSSSTNGSNSNGNGSGSGNKNSVSGNDKNNGTTVTINRPGFTNTDIASATVNGSTDNFIVRITETAEATRAVEAALTAEYGSLENIRYFPMDITLWDSTGTVKITDTTGITVDITIPIPTDFVNFGGNNKAAGVVNDRLDKLSPKFTTIDDVPCITFRATHFSPYAIYVDVTNLSDGAMLDSTPKTGDGIHPKWFLAIGLASVSVVLFLKKDKKQVGRRAKLA